MATFMEEFRKGFRFVGYGESGEKSTFTGSDGEIVRNLPVHVLGKSFNFRAESEEEFSSFPAAGTAMFLLGALKRRRNSVEGLVGQLSDYVTAGKPGWKPPTDSDFLAGLRFEGSGVVFRTSSGVHQGISYSNIQVGSLGYTLVFKRIDPSIFERITENAQAYFAGTLEPKVVVSDKFVTDELIPEIRQYRLFGEKAGDAGGSPPSPGGKEKPAA
jgi:hypothetical protein